MKTLIILTHFSVSLRQQYGMSGPNALKRPRSDLVRPYQGSAGGTQNSINQGAFIITTYIYIK